MFSRRNVDVLKINVNINPAMSVEEINADSFNK